jgi:hypothetical protein
MVGEMYKYFYRVTYVLTIIANKSKRIHFYGDSDGVPIMVRAPPFLSLSIAFFNPLSFEKIVNFISFHPE